MENIASLCTMLSNVTALWPQLQQLSMEDGLRLEAARGLLGSSHGDLMTMAQHMWLTQSLPSKNHQLKVVALSQFTNSEESFANTAQELCKFGSDILSRSNRSVARCTEAFTQQGWLGSTSNNIVGRHVTSDKLSSREKQRLKKMLLEDPVLGPPLKMIQDFVQQMIGGEALVPEVAEAS
eukprot:CAMPEP_0116546596 /NCGR_PEP_ID=MMETSP0397-20121206/3308_1 /TAXON_ID=216820 /ORGANISM="Cyclophora tenuis, Strain ECT3854" /LENGTH=179 /DNA_ID=CAMNT_0004071031 /DNA_START=18 /DNA_END=557 /DNA_ORIENTATION=-